MKLLQRPDPPVCLSDYQHGEHNWDDVSPDDKQTIWQSLDDMQGNFCAYCECRLIDDQYGTPHCQDQNSRKIR